MDAVSENMGGDRINKRIDEGTLAQLASAAGISGERQEAFAAAVQAYHTGPKLVIERDTLKFWANVARDRNPIHLYPIYAQESEFEFKDTPAHATLIAAHVEQYINGLASIVNRFLDGEQGAQVEKFEYAGQNLSFKRPLYPDKTLEWTFSEPKISDGALVLSLSGVNEKGKPIVEPIDKKPNVVLRRSPLLSPPYLGRFVGESPLIKDSARLTSDELKDFYRCIGKPSAVEFPFMYAAALVPSALLEFIRAKTGKYQGVYASQDFMFHNPPKIGEFQILIHLAGAPVFKRRYNEYPLNALVMQGDSPILSGEVVCNTGPSVKLV